MFESLQLWPDDIHASWRSRRFDRLGSTSTRKFILSIMMGRVQTQSTSRHVPSSVNGFDISGKIGLYLKEPATDRIPVWSDPLLQLHKDSVETWGSQTLSEMDCARSRPDINLEKSKKTRNGRLILNLFNTGEHKQ